MEYNTTRDKLIISEYGRNIQKMISYAMEIEDKEKRTIFAEHIIRIMAHLQPQQKDFGDYKHKLWDHLHIISDFKLDVNSPYPSPSKEEKPSNPEKIVYPKHRIRYMHYGNNINLIIDRAITFEEGPEKEALILNISNHLKKAYLNWNKESVDNEWIARHLLELSKGKLELKDPTKLISTDVLLSQNRKRKPHRTSGGSSHHGKRRR